MLEDVTFGFLSANFPCFFLEELELIPNFTGAIEPLNLHVIFGNVYWLSSLSKEDSKRIITLLQSWYKRRKYFKSY